MIKIIKIRIKQIINNVLYYYNGFNTTLIHNLLFNFEVFI